MALGRNLLAGLANSAWSALISLAVVPFYVKYLGMDAYGLVGFFMTAQVMFQLLDMGLAPTMNREVARFSASGDLKAAGNLLHTLSLIYWLMALVIAALMILAAPLIASHWLDSKALPNATIIHSLMLMGLVVGSRWPIGLYHATLIGAQRMTVSSVVNMSMVTIGAIGAVMVLAFVSPTIEAFFLWQAGVGLVYALTVRKAAWKVIGRSNVNKFDRGELKRIWRITAGMSAIGVTGVLFSQLDKLVLSKVLTLDEFGHYTLAAIAVSGLFILITPVFNAMYPRFSALVATNDADTLRTEYARGTRMLASVLFPAAMVLTVFGEDLLYLWTRDSTIAASAAPVIALLAMGSALHGVMHFPYALQLAHGATRLALTIYLVLIVFMLPLFVLLPLRLGPLGGGVAWLAAMVFYMLFGTWFMHRHLAKGEGAKWLVREVGVPLLLSLSAGAIVWQYLVNNPTPGYMKVAVGIFCAIVLPLSSILSSGPLRVDAANLLEGWFCRLRTH